MKQFIAFYDCKTPTTTTNRKVSLQMVAERPVIPYVFHSLVKLVHSLQYWMLQTSSQEMVINLLLYTEYIKAKDDSNILIQIALSKNVLSPDEDFYMWRNSITEPPSLFSASKLWSSLYPNPGPVPWYKAAWFKKRIPKHAFITWIIVWDIMKTRDKLISWGLMFLLLVCSVVRWTNQLHTFSLSVIIPLRFGTDCLKEAVYNALLFLRRLSLGSLQVQLRESSPKSSSSCFKLPYIIFGKREIQGCIPTSLNRLT